MFEAVAVLGGLGLVFAIGLGIASRYLVVYVKPEVERVTEALPGLNCGRCGYPSCSELAEAIVAGKEPAHACVRASHEANQEIGRILGQEIQEPMIAVLKCGGGWQQANRPFRYLGARDCRVAVSAGGGEKACTYGCIGLGTCVEVCPSNAIVLGRDGLPIIDRDACVGCGVCVRVCPRHVIELVPTIQRVVVACENCDTGRAVRPVCSVGCIGCGACVRACQFDAVKVINNLARIDYAKCTNCRACATKCPTHTITVKLPAPEKELETAGAAGN